VPTCAAPATVNENRTTWFYPGSRRAHATSHGKAGFEKPLHGYIMWEGEAALSLARIPAGTSQHLKRTMSRGCGIRSTLFTMLFRFAVPHRAPSATPARAFYCSR